MTEHKINCVWTSSRPERFDGFRADGFIPDRNWEDDGQDILASFHMMLQIFKDQKERRPEQCKGCRFYNESFYLKCAVNPELNANCKDWEKE